MMIEPPVDKLLNKTECNVYVLSNAISKRAKEIETVRRVELDTSENKAITVACQELLDGKFVINEI